MVSLKIRPVFKNTMLSAFCLMTALAHAEGGIAVMGTRVVFDENASQAAVKIMNTSQKNSFLVQSWVEDASGHKSSDFIVTPPLYVSAPKDSNSLRIVYTGKELPKDRESLFYFIEKAIPSVDKKETEQKNLLLIATANRLKMFARPAGLNYPVSDAPDKLTFSMAGKKLDINNPSPYYLTLSNVSVSGHKMDAFMVPPKNHTQVSIPAGKATQISYQTINDYGASTPVIKKNIQ